jgi:hypothetical protein
MKQLRRTPAEQRTRLAQDGADASSFDFIAFRDYPLVEFPEGCAWALDQQFLLEKMGSGVFWLLHREDPTLDKKANGSRNQGLRTWWGRLFEEYAHRLMTVFYSETGDRYHRFPEGMAAGSGSCDAWLDCGSKAMVFEYKGSYLNQPARLSSDPNVLEEDLRRKFASRGSAGKAYKGVFQLARCVKQARSGELADGPRRDQPIQAVLVGLDLALGASMVNWRLQAWFEEALRENDVDATTIAPLCVLTIEDLEDVLPYTSNRSLLGMVEQQRAMDPEAKGPFREFMQQELFAGGKRDNEWIGGRARAWKDALRVKYFPRGRAEGEL